MYHHPTPLRDRIEKRRPVEEPVERPQRVVPEWVRRRNAEGLPIKDMTRTVLS